MYIIHNDKVLTYIDYTPSYQGINVTEFGQETNSIKDDTRSHVPLNRHNHIVHFILDGEGTFSIDGKTHSLSRGKAFLITPKNLVSYYASSEKWIYCWITLSGLDCDTLFEQCGFKGLTVFDFEPEDIAPLTEMLSVIADKKNFSIVNAPDFPLRVNKMMYGIFGNFAAKLRHSQPQAPEKSASIIDTAVAYMRANLNRQMNISQLCDELNISRTYFSTLFEATLKQPPYQYLQNLRMQQASELLLRNKNLHIYEVAEMVGFASTAQFCKYFRKVNTCSPSEFRERYKAPEE